MPSSRNATRQTQPRLRTPRCTSIDSPSKRAQCRLQAAIGQQLTRPVTLSPSLLQRIRGR